MPSSKYFFKQFPGDIWIETGTYMGEGILHALNANYKKIISIELSKKFANDASKNFEDKSNVKIFTGKSYEILPSVLEVIKNEHVVFWLDAHYSACGTAGEDYPQPLLKELEAIKTWKEKNTSLNRSPTILIDDMRTFTHENCGFTEKEIINFLLSIDSRYQIIKVDGYQEHTGKVFEKDILVSSIELV